MKDFNEPDNEKHNCDLLLNGSALVNFSYTPEELSKKCIKEIILRGIYWLAVFEKCRFSSRWPNIEQPSSLYRAL